MPQAGTEQRPLILKNKKKGNRKLGLSSKFYSKENKQKYHQGWDRIFGGNNKDFNKKDIKSITGIGSSSKKEDTNTCKINFFTGCFIGQ